MSEKTGNFPQDPAVPPVVPLDPSARTVADLPPISVEKFVAQAMEDYETPLIGYAATILNDVDRARDVVQDTFARLCEQDIAKVRDNLKAWLYTVCRNRSLDILRKEKRSQPLEDIRWKKVAGTGLQPDEQADLTERISQLSRYLHHLSDNQRQVIILKFQQGLSYQDIRKVTGLSLGNVGFLIHTGLKRLRDILPSDIRD